MFRQTGFVARREVLILQNRRTLRPGEAADRRGQEKIAKYRNLAAGVNMRFFPLIHESYGRLGVPAEKVIDTCAGKIATNKRVKKALILFYWRSRFSMLLQQMLARACQERSLKLLNPGVRRRDDECYEVDFRDIARAD